MPNNSPSLSLFWRFNFKLPTCHLPATSYVCVFTTPPSTNPQANLPPATAATPSLRLHGLQLSLMPITALPLCLLVPSGPPLRASVPRSLPFVSSSHPLPSRFLRLRRAFCSSQLLNNFAACDPKQGTSVVIESYI
jgi:hypothetical protein